MAAAEASREKMLAKLAAIPDVQIDGKGQFKYILIKVKDSNDESVCKSVVRGFARAYYHADILEEVQPGIESLGLIAICVGGGRIEHKPDEHNILVYGYSMGFGRADHKKTVAILNKEYPNYTISSSNEGY